jgi:hypothetical protein
MPQHLSDLTNDNPKLYVLECLQKIGAPIVYPTDYTRALFDKIDIKYGCRDETFLILQYLERMGYITRTKRVIRPAYWENGYRHYAKRTTTITVTDEGMAYLKAEREAAKVKSL